MIQTVPMLSRAPPPQWAESPAVRTGLGNRWHSRTRRPGWWRWTRHQGECQSASSSPRGSGLSPGSSLTDSPAEEEGKHKKLEHSNSFQKSLRVNGSLVLFSMMGRNVAQEVERVGTGRLLVQSLEQETSPGLLPTNWLSPCVAESAVGVWRCAWMGECEAEL